MEGFLMAKSGLGIMVSLDLFLAHKHCGGDSTNNKLRACKQARNH
jgi:hypothetical protein